MANQNQVKFVVCERLHEGGDAVANLLTKYTHNSQTFIFADGDPDCFNPDDVLMFDQYDAAETIVNLAWDLNKTFLGVAIWESENPTEIDYRYVRSGKAKNLEVKRNRESLG